MTDPKSVHVPSAVDAAPEADYSAPSRDDFEALPRDRVWVRSLEAGDLDAIARIDRAITGGERAAYLRAKMDEALHDSGVRVSLVAEVEGHAAGFVMARVDFGDFGRPEPTAVLDTIGVDPARTRQGVGAALVSQLMVNLAALHVDRLETRVAPGDLDLIGFLFKHGARPSQRLAFTKRLG